MSKLSYVLDLIRYYGLKGFMRKVWEKTVVDHKRFAVKNVFDMPDFQQYSGRKEISYEVLPLKPRSVFYWIHFFYPQRQGGTERFLLNLAGQQQGNIHIFTLGTEKLERYPSRISGIVYREYIYLGLPVVEFRYIKTPDGLFYKKIDSNDPIMGKFMEYWVHKERPEFVHCVYPQPYASGLSICKSQSIPYIVTLTDFNILCHYATMVDMQGCLCPGCEKGNRCRERCRTGAVQAPDVRYRASSDLLKNAAYVTVPSNFVAKVIHQEYTGIDPIVIPHGISEEFQADEKTNRETVRRFAYFGTLAPMKGVHLLLQAFLACKNETLELHIYGTGEFHYCKQLQRLTQNDPRILFHGKVSPCEMPKYYRENDCIVVPSMWYETYNFVVREALACGKIVLVADIGAMPEVIQEHQNGLVFKAGSVSSLTRAIQDAVLTRWPVQDERFPTPEMEAKAYERLYEEMSCAGS